MTYLFVEGSRTSCAAIVVEFLLKFLDNRILDRLVQDKNQLAQLANHLIKITVGLQLC